MDIVDLGIVGYEEALSVQQDLLRKRIAGSVPDTLVMLEHKPVVTLGRIDDGRGIIDRSFFEDNNIPVISTGRGGQITCHMPGQLVIYPIVDLAEKKKDVSFYIDLLEAAASAALEQLGVSTLCNEERRGVWAGGRKIAFIGIAVKRWVTYHGIAININNDLESFMHMHPCGESDIRVTSAREQLGRGLEMAEVKRVFADRLENSLTSEYAMQSV
ncbi:MAG: lipoyl(octanoyl) transferase LipB [Candidatus Omnitrophota bacterium]